MTERCPKCQGAGWLKPLDDTRNILQRMTFVRCEACDNGYVDYGGESDRKSDRPAIFPHTLAAS